MRAAVITFPGSNCDRDLAVAMEAMFGPGAAGLAPGDRAARSRPDRRARRLLLRRLSALRRHRRPLAGDAGGGASRPAGRYVLGVCNGFQILAEAGLLPGALMRNAGLALRLPRRRRSTSPTRNSAFTSAYGGQRRSACRWRITTATTSSTRDAWPGSRTRAGSPSATATTPTARPRDIAGVLNERGQRAGPDAASRSGRSIRCWAAPTAGRCSARCSRPSA